MAKKSKTQRAKASASRQQRKAEREKEELNPQEKAVEVVEEKPKKSLFKKSDSSAAPASSEPKKPAKKTEEKKPKKKRFQFFRDVKAEMKRVTWPTRTDVLRWSGVVVVALLFFGVFVALLDNAIITPLLVLVSGFGA